MNEYKEVWSRAGGKSEWAEAYSLAIKDGYAPESARIMADRYVRGDTRLFDLAGLAVLSNKEDDNGS